MRGWDHRVFGPVGGEPQHDPALDVPFHCPWCGADGTREDVEAVSADDGTDGLMCPWCMSIVWDTP
jgi:hypothetical protein